MGVQFLHQTDLVNLVISGRLVAKSFLPTRQSLTFPMMITMMILVILRDMETLL